MHKKRIALVLVCLLTFLFVAQSIAYASDYPDWPVEYVNYRSLSGDAATAEGIVSLLLYFLGYGKQSVLMAVASAILGIFGGDPWTIYMKDEMHISPDSGAYYMVTKFYADPEYDEYLGETYSPIYYLGVSPAQ